MKNTARPPNVIVSAGGSGMVSQAGALLLTQVLQVTGLRRRLSEGLEGWRAARAIHDPGKIIADLAVALALGGDCLADVAVLREQPALFGPVASDPVISRLVSQLAREAPRALTAIRAARAAAREQAWDLGGQAAPGVDGELITIDIDATIVIAHSEKEQAAPAWKKTFGFHPLTAWADHGAGGNGEPLAIVLRAGNAGSNTAADHVQAARLAVAQLPRHLRRKVLIRADSGGGTHEFLSWLTARSRRLHYSVGMTVTQDVQAAVLKVPQDGWTPAYDGDGQVRQGARVRPFLADDNPHACRPAGKVEQTGDVRDPRAVPDLPVSVVSRRPGAGGDLEDRLLHVLGDRHADGVVQPPGPGGQPAEELVRPAAGVGADQHLPPQVSRELRDRQPGGRDVVGGGVRARVAGPEDDG